MQMEENMSGEPFKLTLIRAGAGAGKTTALIDNVINCILSYHAEKKIFPRVAVSTFTRKATREIKERMLIKALERQNTDFIQYINYSPSLQISTLHGIFNRFIQTYGYKINFSPGTTITNEKDSHELFISILKYIVFEQKTGTAILDHYSFKEMAAIVKQYILHIQNQPKGSPISKKEIQDTLNEKKNILLKELKIKQSKKQSEALLELQNEEIHIDTFTFLSLELEKLSKEIIPVWNQKKRELSQITLNDLETMTMEILKKKGNSTPFKDPIWDFWFLDEYQDTSQIQKNILDLLSKNSQMFIVGDPQQSIYYFRGADVSVFQQKEQEAEKTSLSEIKHLNTNYRSCSELISFFNDFFPEDTFKKMKPVNTIYKKEKEVARLILHSSSQKKINREEIELQEAESRINELLKQKVKPEDIAVLARQNKPLYQLAQYLKNKKRPIHLHSSGSFTNRREVIDSLFLLRFLLNPHDDENLIGLLRTPYCRIPDQTLADWIAKKTDAERGKQSKKSIWSFLLTANLNKEPAKHTIQKIKSHFENTEKTGIIQSFQNALESLGFIDLSYYQDPTGVREANLWKLIYCLKEYESKREGNLSAFVDYLLHDSLTTDSEINYSQNAVSAIENSGIQIMTIHAAKGLEFKHIILIKLCSGFKQAEKDQYFINQKETDNWTVSVRSQTEDKRIKSSLHKKIQAEQKNIELQEFDRLLYVALTRAKETVTLIGSGKPEKNSWPSRFPFLSSLKPGHHQTEHYTYYVSHT